MPAVSRCTDKDRQAIIDQLIRYCHAMDRIDPALGYSLWGDDATVDYGRLYQGTARAFIDWVCDLHRSTLARSHQLANILIATDGDRATSESYVTASLVREIGDQVVLTTVRGRYIDSWQRTADRWTMSHRRFAEDITFDQTMPSPPGHGR